MKIKSFLLAFGLLISSLGFALDDIPDRPQPARLVNDYVEMLSSTESGLLESKLAQFAAETGTQIVVIIVDDFAGYDKSSFAIEVGEQWGVGQAEFDNGVVIAIKEKRGNQRGEIFIATGYGIEPLIPDITAKQIIEYEIITAFKQGDFYGGLDAGTNTIMSLALEEFTADGYQSKKKKEEGFPWQALLGLLFIAFLIFGVSAIRTARYARTHNMSWVAAWMLMSATNNSHRGSWSNFKGGSGGFGGFGGFGGGGFGGGGAGGSW